MCKLCDEAWQKYLSPEECTKLMHVLNHHVHPSCHLSNALKKFLLRGKQETNCEIWLQNTSLLNMSCVEKAISLRYCCLRTCNTELNSKILKCLNSHTKSSCGVMNAISNKFDQGAQPIIFFGDFCCLSIETWMVDPTFSSFNPSILAIRSHKQQETVLKNAYVLS